MVGSLLNFLIVDPGIVEFLILTDCILKSADLELNGHRVVRIKVIVLLDQFLDAGKEILSF